MRKVVGYVRVSRKGTKYEEKESPEMQRKAIREFCNREGYSLERIYEDLDYSGGNDRRPDFQIMMNDIKNNDEVKGIVVYNLSRFSRNIRDILKYLDMLNQKAASFMSVTETFFQMKDTPMRNLMINIFATIADFQRDQTREMVRDSMRSMSARGIHVGGKVPFGYKLDSEKRYVIDEEAAEIV